MKAHILKIAADLFAERGYRGATIRDICHFAKCSVGSIYGHFANKKDLYRQAFRLRASEMEPRLLKSAKLKSASLRNRELTSTCMMHSDFLRMLLVDDFIRAGETTRYFDRLQAKGNLPDGRMRHIQRALRRAAGLLALDTIRINERVSAIEPETAAWTQAFFQDSWPAELKAAA